MVNTKKRRLRNLIENNFGKEEVLKKLEAKYPTSFPKLKKVFERILFKGYEASLKNMPLIKLDET